MNISQLALLLYGAAWTAATPFLRTHKRLKPHFGQRLVPDNWLSLPLGERQKIPASPASEASGLAHPPPLVWIQAASGGEARLVHGIFHALQKRLLQHLPQNTKAPVLHLLCTTWTEQGFAMLEDLAQRAGEGPIRVLPRYFPLDSASCMSRAMRQASPVAIVLLETELWPHMLHAAHAGNVPVFVVNGRMTEKSLAGYRFLFSALLKQQGPKRVLAISKNDAARFSALFGEHIVGQMDNIKFDSVWEMLHSNDLSQPNPADAGNGSFREHSPVILLASVREEEENLLLPVVRSLTEFCVARVPATLVIAPRHMHRVPAWEKHLRSLGLAYGLRSSLAASIVQPVVLWDTFGELPTLYSRADAAFVGGSLAPLGGQNFLEPLGHGLSPVIGPHWGNFHWVSPEGTLPPFIRQVEDASSLTLALQEQTASLLRGAPENWEHSRLEGRSAVKTQFTGWLEQRRGGSSRAADLIWTALEPAMRTYLHHLREPI